MLSCKTFTHLGILALNAVLISGKKPQTPTKKQNYVKNKNYLKSECSSTTKSSESQFRIFFKKTNQQL